jgi:hypothetical protein
MTESEIVLREPPEDLPKYRPNTLIALLDEEGKVRAAIEELTAAGFPGEEIYVLGGKQGAKKLDPSGEGHGVRGRLLRLLERFGEEARLLEEKTQRRKGRLRRRRCRGGEPHGCAQRVRRSSSTCSARL